MTRIVAVDFGEKRIGLATSDASGVESPFAARVRSFASRFERRTGLQVRFHEETLTSDEAMRRLPKTAGREEIDRTAAAVLLEDYLQSVGAARP